MDQGEKLVINRSEKSGVLHIVLHNLRRNGFFILKVASTLLDLIILSLLQRKNLK